MFYMPLHPTVLLFYGTWDGNATIHCTIKGQCFFTSQIWGYIQIDVEQRIQTSIPTSCSWSGSPAWQSQQPLPPPFPCSPILCKQPPWRGSLSDGITKPSAQMIWKLDNLTFTGLPQFPIVRDYWAKKYWDMPQWIPSVSNSILPAPTSSWIFFFF